jgi:hypothetical protein
MQKFSMRISLLLILMLCSLTMRAQKVITTTEDDSTLTLTRDERYDKLVEKQKEINVTAQTMPGYRIQIYFGGNRQKASEVKLDFSSSYPQISAYLTYQQPNFKVRIGDYRSRFEAQKFLKEIEGKYPATFIVPDEVKLPRIK